MVVDWASTWKQFHMHLALFLRLTAQQEKIPTLSIFLCVRSSDGKDGTSPDWYFASWCLLPCQGGERTQRTGTWNMADMGHLYNMIHSITFIFIFSSLPYFFWLREVYTWCVRAPCLPFLFNQIYLQEQRPGRTVINRVVRVCVHIVCINSCSNMKSMCVLAGSVLDVTSWFPLIDLKHEMKMRGCIRWSCSFFSFPLNILTVTTNIIWKKG